MVRKIINLLMRHDGYNFRASCNYNGHNIEFLGENISAIELQARQYFKRKFKIDNVLLGYSYDISAVFQDGLINVAAMARFIDIAPGLLRQYASGSKHPKGKELDKILEGFYVLAKKMNRISQALDGKSLLSANEH